MSDRSSALLKGFVSAFDLLGLTYSRARRPSSSYCRTVEEAGIVDWLSASHDLVKSLERGCTAFPDRSEERELIEHWLSDLHTLRVHKASELVFAGGTDALRRATHGRRLLDRKEQTLLSGLLRELAVPDETSGPAEDHEREVDREAHSALAG